MARCKSNIQRDYKCIFIAILYCKYKYYFLNYKLFLIFFSDILNQIINSPIIEFKGWSLEEHQGL